METVTVTVKGQIYKIGGLYIDRNSNTGYLISANKGLGTFRLSMNGNDWYTNKINILDHELGTITEAPIELEDGEWYMCRASNENNSCQTPYLRYQDQWAEGLGLGCPFVEDVNVMPLYKMVKA